MEREDAQAVRELLWCHRGHELIGEVGLEFVEVTVHVFPQICS
jgi:hypothetical protein